MPRVEAAKVQAKQAAAKRAGQLQHGMETRTVGSPRGLSDEERKARRARAQKEWARTARAQLSEEQLEGVKSAMKALKAGKLETPAFCAAVLKVFREVQDEVARVKLVRAMAMLIPPKFRALYHLLAAGRDAEDVALEADQAGQLEAHEIEPGLFLGGWNAVQSASALRARGITHVLTVGPEEMLVDEVRDDRSFSRKVVSVNDMPEVDLLAHFETCVEFIREAMKVGSVRCRQFLPFFLLSPGTSRPFGKTDHCVTSCNGCIGVGPLLGWPVSVGSCGLCLHAATGQRESWREAPGPRTIRGHGTKARSQPRVWFCLSKFWVYGAVVLVCSHQQ